MDELTRTLAKAREHVTTKDDEVVLDRQWRGLVAKRRRRTVVKVAASAALVLLAAVGAWRMVPTSAPTETATSPSLRLPDGSMVFFLDADTEVTPRVVADARIELELTRGRARFDVSRLPERAFVVDAEDVRVTVVGTEFVVAHETDEIEVDVLEGRVRVEAGDEDRLLRAGDRARFAAHRAASSAVEAPVEAVAMGVASGTNGETASAAPEEEQVVREREPTRTAPAANGTADREATSAREEATSWRALAEEGDFDAAWTALSAADDVRTTDVDDLMLAADAARLSGHPNEAVTYLRRVVDEHTNDSRAPLAAFTIGRVLLRSRPAEAADAFERAARLDPASSLAQDALAREVEAWHRAGRQERARALAEEYLARFPSGVRVDAVRRFGGLD
ncbi:MAG: FecR domain-containing protein [Myxococcota bacterium]|jgi:transmembrane sensor|nr:FecR domain-containing protein [Myxococcota bacterium]